MVVLHQVQGALLLHRNPQVHLKRVLRATGTVDPTSVVIRLTAVTATGTKVAPHRAQVHRAHKAAQVPALKSTTITTSLDTEAEDAVSVADQAEVVEGQAQAVLKKAQVLKALQATGQAIVATVAVVAGEAEEISVSTPEVNPAQTTHQAQANLLNRLKATLTIHTTMAQMAGI